MAKPVPVGDIAKLLKLTDRRVQQLVQGRVLPRPTKGMYEPVSCIHAYIDYLKGLAFDGEEPSLVKERIRLTKSQADISEMERDVKKGGLVERDVVANTLGMVITAFRNRILGLPTKLAPRLVGCTIVEIQQIIDEEVYQALTDMSKGVGVSEECKPQKYAARTRAVSSVGGTPEHVGAQDTGEQSKLEERRGRDNNELMEN